MALKAAADATGAVLETPRAARLAAYEFPRVFISRVLGFRAQETLAVVPRHLVDGGFATRGNAFVIHIPAPWENADEDKRRRAQKKRAKQKVPTRMRRAPIENSAAFSHTFQDVYLPKTLGHWYGRVRSHAVG